MQQLTLHLKVSSSEWMCACVCVGLVQFGSGKIKGKIVDWGFKHVLVIRNVEFHTHTDRFSHCCGLLIKLFKLCVCHNYGNCIHLRALTVKKTI